MLDAPKEAHGINGGVDPNYLLPRSPAKPPLEPSHPQHTGSLESPWQLEEP